MLKSTAISHALDVVVAIAWYEFDAADHARREIHCGTCEYVGPQ
jgi:hypothetical protein